MAKGKQSLVGFRRGMGYFIPDFGDFSIQLIEYQLNGWLSL
ncbi:hypothetical protein LX87_03471 [Larkinella arboricola]|uniref:Uncharacterized protein n=1 Tax=Larkinella arboricola TaxID=643671 RepID=A0A327WT92_LARAB|nr:hypothetical protein LX87_03471 [Larkinella arboricola]